MPKASHQLSKIYESEDEHVHAQSLQNKNMLKCNKRYYYNFMLVYNFINGQDLL